MRAILRFFCLIFALSLLFLTASLSLWRRDASPQLSLFVVNGYEKDSLAQDVFRMNPDGSGRVNLTNQPLEYRVLVSTSPNSQWFLLYQEDAFLIQSSYPETKFTISSAKDEYWAGAILWSPDSRYVSFESHLGNSNSGHITVFDLTTRTRHDLSPLVDPNCPETDTIASETSPSWSPDGQWLYFNAFTCNHEKILYRMHPDGSDRQLILENSILPDYFFWLFDSQWIYFQEVEESPFFEESPLYRISADGQTLEIVAVLPNRFHLIGVTPEWLYILMKESPSSSSQTPQIYRMRWDGSQLEVLTNMATRIFRTILAPDKSYFYFNVDDATQSIYRVRSDGSHLAKIAEGMTLINISPDSQWIYGIATTNQELWAIHSDGRSKKSTHLRIRGFGSAWLTIPHLTFESLTLGMGGAVCFLLSFGNGLRKLRRR